MKRVDYRGLPFIRDTRGESLKFARIWSTRVRHITDTRIISSVIKGHKKNLRIIYALINSSRFQPDGWNLFSKKLTLEHLSVRNKHNSAVRTAVVFVRFWIDFVYEKAVRYCHLVTASGTRKHADWPEIYAQMYVIA